MSLDDNDKKVVAELIANAVKPQTDNITKLATSLEQSTKAQEELAKSVKIVSDTLAALPPATATKEGENKPGEKKEGDATAAAPLTKEEIAAMVKDGITAATQAQQQTAALNSERDTFVKDVKNGLARLPAEFVAKLSADKTKWADEAKAIVASWEGFAKQHDIKLPDVGGANREGGETAATGASGTPATGAAATLANTSPGVADLASVLVIPPATQQPTASQTK